MFDILNSEPLLNVAEWPVAGNYCPATLGVGLTVFPCLFFFSLFFFLQNKANVELELKTYVMKFDQEVLAHKETVAKFNADKKNILMSTEEANMEAIKGLCCTIDSCCTDKRHTDVVWPSVSFSVIVCTPSLKLSWWVTFTLPLHCSWGYGCAT